MDVTESIPRRSSVERGSASDWHTSLDVSSEESSTSDDSAPPTLYSRAASPSMTINAAPPGDAAITPAKPLPAPASCPPRSPLGKLAVPGAPPDPRRPVAEQFSPLVKAARRDDIALIDRLLTPGSVSDEMPAVDIDGTDEDGCTALHHAAAKGSNRALLALLQHGARTDLLSVNGATALMLAAKKHRGAAVEILLAHGDASNASDSNSGTPAWSKKLNPYHYQLAARGYDDMPEEQRQEALCKAVAAGTSSMAARMLATGGLDFEYPDSRHTTLLGYAVRTGDEATVRLLLCAGARVNGIDPADTSPLMHAVLSLQHGIIPVLRRAGASPIQERADGESALTLAVRLDSLPVMDALRENKRSLLAGEQRGGTLLTLAVAFKSTSIARQLLNLGVDLPDRAGSRALAVLAKKGDQAGVDFLLRAGADPDHQANDGHSAFTLAAANGHLDVVHTLLRHRKHSAVSRAPEAMQLLLNQADKMGRTALMLAALNGHQSMVECLLKEGARLPDCDINGMNALLWAVAEADSGMVNLLFNHRASHVLLDHAGNSGIVIAAAIGNLDTLKVLLTPVRANSLYDVNTPNRKGDTALTVAAASGHAAVVRELLQAQAHVLHVNAAGRSAKLEAIAHGHGAIANLLHAAEQAFLRSAESTTGILAALARLPVLGLLLPNILAIKVPEVDKEGNSALALAARNGHKDMVAGLIGMDNGDAGVPLAINMGSAMRPAEHDNDRHPVGERLAHGWRTLPVASAMELEQQNIHGMTPLCLAAASGRDDVASLLLERGALVNHVSINRCTPLWLAASLPAPRPAVAGDEEQEQASAHGETMIRLLLDKGADVNQPSARGETPLHAAAAFGRLATVRTLLQHKANIDAHDRFGLSALGHAAMNGHAGLVKYLLDQGAEPDAAPGSHAPLTLAAANGHDEVVTLLKQRGATVQHMDDHGRTALIVAAKHGKSSTVALLLTFGANLHQQCQQGYTAQQHAGRAGHGGIVKLLQNGHPRPRDN